jgi:hypothetical protein
LRAAFALKGQSETLSDLTKGTGSAGAMVIWQEGLVVGPPGSRLAQAFLTALICRIDRISSSQKTGDNRVVICPILACMFLYDEN